MRYNEGMKPKKKPMRVYRGVYLPVEVDRRIRAIAERDRRSMTQTVEILLSSALGLENRLSNEESTSQLTSSQVA